MTEVVVVPAPGEGGRINQTKERPSPREGIFNAATQLFGEYGYNGASMRDIAKAVGILPGSLYAHITSKEDILLEIIETGVDRFNNAVDQISASGAPPDQLIRAAVREHLDIVADSPERTQIVFHQWRFLNPGNRARLLAKRAHYAEFYTRTLRSGMDQGIFSPSLDLKVAVLTILGALNWTPEWLSPDGPASPRQLADSIADNLLQGLTGRS
jgi:AcrR family transcriptional regulator